MTDVTVSEAKLECCSTHCERRQECASPRECVGDGKRRDPVIAAMTWISEAADRMAQGDLEAIASTKGKHHDIIENLAAIASSNERQQKWNAAIIANRERDEA